MRGGLKVGPQEMGQAGSLSISAAAGVCRAKL